MIYEINADHGAWPGDGFCRVILEKDTKTGGPYTVEVELLNVVRPSIVYYGHPGVMYNIVDENNFDFIYFRLVLYDVCSLPPRRTRIAAFNTLINR